MIEEFPYLYWTTCAAHSIDLILEDLSKLDRIPDVIFSASTITNYIYKHEWVVKYMKFTNGRDIIRSGITRFATNFYSLESLVKKKSALREMWESREWLNSRLGRSTEDAAITVRRLILSSTKQAEAF